MSEPYWSALGARAGDGGVDYEGVWSGATPYLAGDVVIYNGVHYLAVNPSTGVTPSGLSASDIGIALPATPFDGQEFTLVDSLTAPTYSWKFRYVAAKASNKWVFIGGAPRHQDVLTSETTASATYANLSGGATGPSFVLPVAGDYIIEVGAHVGQTGVSDTYMSYDIGATPAVDADAAVWRYGGINAVGNTLSYQRLKSGLLAGTVVTKYKTSAPTATFIKRWLCVTPVAVGG